MGIQHNPFSPLTPVQKNTCNTFSTTIFFSTVMKFSALNPFSSNLDPHNLLKIY